MERANTRGVGVWVAAALCVAAVQSAAAADTEEDKNASWKYHIALGAQLLPDYDETGRSSGLSEQEFFAQIIADGRFGNDCDAPSKRVTICAVGPWHAGINVTLLGTPVVRGDKPQFSPDEFNDVAQSIVASKYLYW